MCRNRGIYWVDRFGNNERMVPELRGKGDYITPTYHPDGKTLAVGNRNYRTELYDTAMHIASRGPFLVAKQVLPAMRAAGRGTLLFTNNSSSLRGRKRYTGQSLYYPRTIMRSFAQALTEEYSEHGVHVANVVVDGLIDSPGTRELPMAKDRPEIIMDPVEIADAFWYLHSQDRSCWTHELQLTPHPTNPSF